MSIFSKIFERLSGMMAQLKDLEETFAELRRMAVDVIISDCSPIEYARRRENRNVLAELFRGLFARYRARCYNLRFSPCQHRAGGVMIKKKERLVRRKR